MTAIEPLILTLTIDEPSQRHFNELRKQHFPPERNYLDAHVTLFHHLPPEEQIIHDIETLVNVFSPFEVEVSGLKNIGNGVAYALTSDKIKQMHAGLQKEWYKWLTPQDRQKIWPHITVQNKVDSEKSKNTYQELSQNFKPFTIFATGLSLWKYLNGPWEFLRHFPFND